jgi:pimeloyl-ACP methyl ester carboxylesterase
MRFLTLLGLVSSLVAGCQEAPPANCQTLSREPIENPLSFVSYEAAGRSVTEWRTDLTNHLRAGLKLPVILQAPPPTVTRTSVEDGQVRTEYTASSLVDEAPIPFAIVEPAPSVESKDHLVLLVHGHGETWDAPFEEQSEMHDVGGVLLDEGYAVATLEVRSFGEFLIDGLDHDAYLAETRDGQYIGEAVADTYSVAVTVVEHVGVPEGKKVSILGHSLGGYIALHVGALTEGLTKVISSGFFVPYDCIDTDTHHDDPPDMVGVAELYDSAGLASPGTTVDLLFGRLDLIFTNASLQMHEELVYIYEQTGAPTVPGLYISPELSHEVDTDHVLEALSKS